MMQNTLINDCCLAFGPGTHVTGTSRLSVSASLHIKHSTTALLKRPPMGWNRGQDREGPLSMTRYCLSCSDRLQLQGNQTGKLMSHWWWDMAPKIWSPSIFWSQHFSSNRRDISSVWSQICSTFECIKSGYSNDRISQALDWAILHMLDIRTAPHKVGGASQHTLWVAKTYH